MKQRERPDLRPVTERTLDELEGAKTGPPPFDSHLVTEIHRLRRVPLKRFRLEDLRLMIGQGIGLQYLIPIALEHLRSHPLAQGDFYPGDLLITVARTPAPFWAAHPHLLPNLVQALQGAERRLRKVHTIPAAQAELRAALTRFELTTPEP